MNQSWNYSLVAGPIKQLLPFCECVCVSVLEVDDVSLIWFLFVLTATQQM